MKEHEIPQLSPDSHAPAKEKWHTPLVRVTPLSKYLAMALFVVLPFVGFWLGVEFGKWKAVTSDNLGANEVDLGIQFHEQHKGWGTENRVASFDILPVLANSKYFIQEATSTLLVDPGSVSPIRIYDRGPLYLGSVVWGSSGPVVSTRGSYMAVIDPSTGNIVLHNVSEEQRGLLTEIIGTTTDTVGGLIIGFSPLDTKLLLTIRNGGMLVYSRDAFGWTEEYNNMQPLPLGIDEGYYVADLIEGAVYYLPNMLFREETFRYCGWLDEETLLFAQDGVLYDYNVYANTVLSSHRISLPDQDVMMFRYFGTNNDSYLYQRNNPNPRADGPIERKMGPITVKEYAYPRDDYQLVLQKGNDTKVIVEYDFTDLVSASFSRNGRYVEYVLRGETGSDHHYRYNITSGASSEES